jgi:adenylate kinase family enzyme
VCPDTASVRLTYPGNAVVVVAGLPGAGKTTLIRRITSRTAAVVVDTDEQRRRGGRASNVRHYRRIAAAVWGRQPVVIHSRGTVGTLRRLICLLSFLRGRPAHLILLDAPRAAAEDGQRRRGRLVSRARMDREAARWERLLRRGLRGERWRSVTVLDRASAARVEELHWEQTYNPWGRQASTRSAHGGGRESRCRRPRKTPATTQVRSLTTTRSPN